MCSLTVQFTQETEQIVVYKPHMASLLHRLQDARALISLQIGKETTCYNSLIMRIESRNEFFYLDEISPHLAHKKISRGVLLHIIGRIKGVVIEFTCKVMQVENDTSIAMYKVAFPDRLAYRQRRRHFRANVNDAQNISIAIPYNFQQHILGELVDISASGICTKISYAESQQLDEDHAIHEATLRLPGSNKLTLNLKVRNIRHFPEEGYSLVGGEFIDMHPTQQSHLDRIVAMLDRSQRRSATV